MSDASYSSCSTQQTRVKIRCCCTGAACCLSYKASEWAKLNSAWQEVFPARSMHPVKKGQTTVSCRMCLLGWQEEMRLTGRAAAAGAGVVWPARWQLSNLREAAAALIHGRARALANSLHRSLSGAQRGPRCGRECATRCKAWHRADWSQVPSLQYMVCRLTLIAILTGFSVQTAY